MQSEGFPVGRVLVMEDEYLIADDLRRAITRAGAEVLGPVASLRRSHLQVRRGYFDFVLLDINLRDEKAYPIADELLQKKVPFVFETGYETDHVPDRFASVAVWKKPFNYDELTREIIRICSKVGVG
jgi:DNA-binding response OmpR family regulator